MDKKLIKECSDKLKKMRQDILSTLGELQESSNQIEGDNDVDEMDKSANLTEMDRIKSLVQQHSLRIRLIDAAERRMASGDFGVCILCEEEIPKKRLLANPVAIRCVSCQEEQEMQDKENKQRTGGKAAPGSFTDDLGESASDED